MFAKAPVPGEAKTRLVPRLGAWGAARLQLQLTRHTLALAHAARCGPVELHLARRHSLFRRARLQRGADLGSRMLHAFRSAKRPLLLVGSDCPVLDPKEMRRAWRYLRAGYDAVIAPAEDGGYALIGLRRPLPELFRDIAWGSDGVYAETAARLAPYRWRSLRAVWDVDRPADLERLRSLRVPLARLRGVPRCAYSRARSGGWGRT